MDIKVGTKLQIRDLECKVIGFIEYVNTKDRDKSWTEYRLSTNKGEFWLSVDDEYGEYSMSFPANDIRGNIGAQWHRVDEGIEKVRSRGGDVDVDYGETASFYEFEDASEEKILSMEVWEDGTEYSYGYYIEKSEIVVTGYEQPAMDGPKLKTFIMTCFIGFWILCSVSGSLLNLAGANHSISKYLKKSSVYTYVTSITGNKNQKADVYEYTVNDTTDNVALNIINGIEGDTQSITQKDDTSDDSIAILTKKEYCLIYHPEDDAQKVYVQVSKRKYNYTSDNAPYKSSESNTKWYRSHYYTTGYSVDSGHYSRSPSAYQTYSGDTIHNVGNGYFDSYSGSVRQSSINSRRSSGGGGK